jgi:hypothetical protein
MALGCLKEGNRRHLVGTSTRKDYAVAPSLVIFAEAEFEAQRLAKGDLEELEERVAS